MRTAFGPPGRMVYVPVKDAPEFGGTVSSSYDAFARRCETMAPYPDPGEIDWTPVVPTIAIDDLEKYFRPPFRLR